MKVITNTVLRYPTARSSSASRRLVSAARVVSTVEIDRSSRSLSSDAGVRYNARGAGEYSTLESNFRESATSFPRSLTHMLLAQGPRSSVPPRSPLSASTTTPTLRADIPLRLHSPSAFVPCSILVQPDRTCAPCYHLRRRLNLPQHVVLA